MEILKSIEQELRADQGLMKCIRQAAVYHKISRHANDRASDSFLHSYLNRDREGAKLYCFFEDFRGRHGWNQKECPKRLFLAVLKELIAEVERDA